MQNLLFRNRSTTVCSRLATRTALPERLPRIAQRCPSHEIVITHTNLFSFEPRWIRNVFFASPLQPLLYNRESIKVHVWHSYKKRTVFLPHQPPSPAVLILHVKTGLLYSMISTKLWCALLECVGASDRYRVWTQQEVGDSVTRENGS